MKKLLYIFPLLFCLSCNSDKNHKHDHQHKKKDKSEHKAHEHGDDDGHGHNHDHDHGHANHGKANEHMHQSSVEDLIKRFESPERDEYQQPEKVLAHLGDIKGKKIMDIGSGSGYFSVKMAAKGAEVIAADVDDEFQAFINKRIKENNLSNIVTRKIPYDGPGLQENEVDKVLIVNTYHHIENRSDYFGKVLAGIKEGGELVVVDFFKYEVPVGPPVDHKIAIDVVVNELKEAGFTDFDVNVSLLPYQYIVKAK